MGKIFSLDDGTKATITDALDDLITEFGKDCRLVYQPRLLPCSCNQDHTGKNANHYNAAPAPFWPGNCPLCGGKGKREQEVSENIKLLCAWDPKHFFSPVPSVEIRKPFSLLQTKGFLKDVPKLIKAQYLIFQTAIEGLFQKKFRLLSQPGDRSNIIQNRYFICEWEQFD